MVPHYPHFLTKCTLNHILKVEKQDIKYKIKISLICREFKGFSGISEDYENIERF